MGCRSRLPPIIINVPSEASAYLGMLLRVPLDAGIKMASMENIHKEEGILRMPRINRPINATLIAKSK